MFEQTLLTNRRNAVRRGPVLLAAAFAHLAAFGTVTAASLWTIAPVAEPPERGVVIVQLAPPPPPPAPAAPSRPATAPRAAAPAPPRAAEVQPTVVPAEDPSPPADDPATEIAQLDPNAQQGGGGGGVEGGTGDGTGDGPGVPGGTGEPVQVYDVGGEVLAPVALARVPPQYNELARRAHVQGAVLLEATIDTAGRVVDVHLLKGLGMGLDAAAMDAVARWRFQPGTLHGRPVPVKFRLTVNFSLR